MWQLFVLGSMLASAGENILDKAVLLRQEIDPIVASFYRPLLFFLVTVVIGLLGWFGSLHFFFHWSILLFVPAAIFSSIFYTYLLEKVEVTSIGVVSYLIPFFFLFIDVNIFQVHFSWWQILGILLLVLGGIGFSLDGKTHRMKLELTWTVWAIFLFNIFYTGGQAYLFKYLNAEYELSSPSFFASLWLPAIIGLLLIVLVKGKGHQLVNQSARAYVPRIALSKTLDAAGALFWGQALVFATVAQVSAFEAIFPLVLFVMVLIAQRIFSVRLEEKLDRTHLLWKVCALLLLVIGGFLVS